MERRNTGISGRRTSTECRRVSVSSLINQTHGFPAFGDVAKSVVVVMLDCGCGVSRFCPVACVAIGQLAALGADKLLSHCGVCVPVVSLADS